MSSDLSFQSLYRIYIIYNIKHRTFSTMTLATILNSSYLQPFLGGIIIGTSAIFLMISIGKIAGISGIFYNILSTTPSRVSWQWCFIIGLILSPGLLLPFDFSLPSNISGNFSTFAIAGFLVGLGTQIGSGCTSGHGICGIGRLSMRSFVATCTFMVTAIVTVSLLQIFI